MGCGKKDSTSCVCEVLRAIKDIQDERIDEDCLDCRDCFIEPLGTLTSPSRKKKADTRVFVLSTSDGTPFHAFITDQEPPNNTCVSIYFRVEEVFDNCCARLRVLEPRSRSGAPVSLVGNGACCVDLSNVCDVADFRSTSSCITVDLHCFCAVQCIRDVNLNICD